MRRALITIAITSLALTGVSAPAFAASPSQQECEAQGGTFSNQNGTKVCVLPTVVDPVGNSESSGGKSQTRDTDETQTGQGNLSNKEADTSCTSGPGNSSPCP